MKILVYLLGDKSHGENLCLSFWCEGNATKQTKEMIESVMQVEQMYALTGLLQIMQQTNKNPAQITHQKCIVPGKEEGGGGGR